MILNKCGATYYFISPHRTMSIVDPLSFADSQRNTCQNGVHASRSSRKERRECQPPSKYVFSLVRVDCRCRALHILRCDVLSQIPSHRMPREVWKEISSRIGCVSLLSSTVGTSWMAHGRAVRVQVIFLSRVGCCLSRRTEQKRRSILRLLCSFKEWEAKQRSQMLIVFLKHNA